MLFKSVNGKSPKIRALVFQVEELSSIRDDISISFFPKRF
jgi:hypothetical protein